MFGLGIQELVIVLIIVMVLFGGRKLPELASGMGKAIRNFKKASAEPDENDLISQNNIKTDKNPV